jgi:hypothetical protein
MNQSTANLMCSSTTVIVDRHMARGAAGSD